jgi:hypothetical protein
MKRHWMAWLGFLICTLLLASCSKEYYTTSNDIYVIPGGTIPYKFSLTSCVKGYWATNDLVFRLTASDGTVVFEKAITHDKDWMPSLKTNGKEETVSIKIDILVPASQKVNTTLTGNLIGHVLCPKDNADAGFTEMEVAIDQTLELRVESANAIGNRRANGYISLLGLIAVIAVVWVVGKISGKMKARYRI